MMADPVGITGTTDPLLVAVRFDDTVQKGLALSWRQLQHVGDGLTDGDVRTPLHATTKKLVAVFNDKKEMERTPGRSALAWKNIGEDQKILLLLLRVRLLLRFLCHR